MHTIAVMNYKGGVGKTTLTANLGAEIASRGHRVLLLDLDPQANLTFSFYSVEEWQHNLREERTVRRWYEGDMPGREVDLAELIVSPPRVNEHISYSDGRIDLISSHLGLIDIDLQLAARLAGGTTFAESKRKYLQVHGCLAAALANPEFKRYDLVLIDCAPNFGVVTKTAIIASSHILVPAKADYLSTLGIDYLAGNCDRLKQEYNEFATHGSTNGATVVNPRIIGVVFNMLQIYAGKPITGQHNYMEEVRQNSSVPVLEATVRNSPRHFGDAGETGIPAVLAAPPGDEVAAEIRKLAAEMIDALKK